MQTNTVMNIGDEAARRRLILALGRGKSGKTLWSRWLVETMRARGVSPVAADADWSTPGLSRHDEGAVRLGSEPQADRNWWKTVLANGEELAGRPVVVDFSLDAGLVRKVDPEGTNFAERYTPRGFDVTKVFFFAPDVGDVATFINIGAAVTAASTLLVLNEGAIGSRRSDRFDAVLAHPAVREAIGKGASVVRMPELQCGPGEGERDRQLRRIRRRRGRRSQAGVVRSARRANMAWSDGRGFRAVWRGARARVSAAGPKPPQGAKAGSGAGRPGAASGVSRGRWRSRASLVALLVAVRQS